MKISAQCLVQVTCSVLSSHYHLDMQNVRTSRNLGGKGVKSYFMNMGLDVQRNYVTFSWSGGKRENRNKKAAQITLFPIVSTTTHCLLPEHRLLCLSAFLSPEQRYQSTRLNIFVLWEEGTLSKRLSLSFPLLPQSAFLSYNSCVWLNLKLLFISNFLCVSSLLPLHTHSSGCGLNWEIKGQMTHVWAESEICSWAGPGVTHPLRNLLTRGLGRDSHSFCYYKAFQVPDPLCEHQGATDRDWIFSPGGGSRGLESEGTRVKSDLNISHDRLCDLGQVTWPLWISFSSFANHPQRVIRVKALAETRCRKW